MTPDDFLRLSEAGLTPKQIALVMEIMTREAKEAADKEEARKAKGRERWHRWHNKREPNVSQREQTLANDLRAGDARGEDNLSDKKISGQEDRKGRSPQKATRLPEDWRLPDEWRQEAITAGLPPQRVDPEVSKMVNWSRSSKAGAKLDWRAAWRNWFRRAIEDAPPQRQSTSPPRPRNAGELSYQQLMDQIDEYPSQHDRRLESRNGNGEAENIGGFQKFAVSGDFLRRM